MRGSDEPIAPGLLPDLQMHMIQGEHITLGEVLQEASDDHLEFSSVVCYAATVLGTQTVLRALQGPGGCSLLLPLLRAANRGDARTAILAAYAVHKMAEDEPSVVLGMLCSTEHLQQQQQACPLFHLLAALSNMATMSASAWEEPAGPLAKQQLLSLTGAPGPLTPAQYVARALESVAQAAPNLLLHALLQHTVCWDKLLEGLISSSADTARAAGFTLRLITQTASDEQLHMLAGRVLEYMKGGDDTLMHLGLEALHMLAIAAPSKLLAGLLRDQQCGVHHLLLLAASSNDQGQGSTRSAAVGALVLMAREAAPQQLQALMPAILEAVAVDGSVSMQGGAAAALKALAVNLPSQVLAVLLQSPQDLHQLLQTVCSSSPAAASGAASALRFITRAAQPFQLHLLLSEVLHLLVTGSSSSMAQGVHALNMMAIAAPAALLQALLATPRGVQHVLEAVGCCDGHTAPVALAAIELMTRTAPGPMLRALLAEVSPSSDKSNTVLATSAVAVLSHLASAVPFHVLEVLRPQQFCPPVQAHWMEPQTPRQQSGGGTCSRGCSESTTAKNTTSQDYEQPCPLLEADDQGVGPAPMTF
jgi:hypothetical protein